MRSIASFIKYLRHEYLNDLTYAWLTLLAFNASHILCFVFRATDRFGLRRVADLPIADSLVFKKFFIH